MQIRRISREWLFTVIPVLPRLSEKTTLAIEYVDIQIEKATDISVFDLVLPDDIEEILLE